MKIALFAAIGAWAPAVLAADAGTTSPLEVKIELRVMDFIAAPSDRSTVAVVYDRDDRRSADEAAAILRALRDSLGLARGRIEPRLVEKRTLPAMRDLKAVILPAGMKDESVMRYGIANHTLVLSSGTDCVRDRRCMVGVETLPDVEIGVNSPAITEGGIQFADGFELMVKEY